MARKWTKAEVGANLDKYSEIGENNLARCVAICENGVMLHDLSDDSTHTITIIAGKTDHQYHGHARHLAYEKLGKGLAVYRKSAYTGWYGETV